MSLSPGLVVPTFILLDHTFKTETILVPTMSKSISYFLGKATYSNLRLLPFEMVRRLHSYKLKSSGAVDIARISELASPASRKLSILSE